MFHNVLPSIADLTTSLAHPPPSQPSHNPRPQVQLQPVYYNQALVVPNNLYTLAPRSLTEYRQHDPWQPRHRPNIAPVLPSFHAAAERPHMNSQLATFAAAPQPPQKRRRVASTPTVATAVNVRFAVHGLDEIPPDAPSTEVDMLQRTIYPSIVTKKYSAPALDPTRSHLVVYEYPLGAHWVIWDYETGYVHLTGLWRAALHEQAQQQNKNGVVVVKPNAKADIVKLLESTPKALHGYITRVRGGFLKIQGTWMPFDLCKRLARRFCYYIRFRLVPIFGPDFPELCLRPNEQGFGELRFDDMIDTVGVPAGPAIRRRVLDLATQRPPHSLYGKDSLSRLSSSLLSPTGYNQQSGSPVLPRASISRVSPVLPRREGLSSASPALPRRDGSMSAAGFTSLPPLSSPPMDNRMGQVHIRSSPIVPSRPLLTPPSSQALLASAESKPKVLSRTDMEEIMNASKCLQRLSQRLSEGGVRKMRIDSLLS